MSVLPEPHTLYPNARELGRAGGADPAIGNLTEHDVGLVARLAHLRADGASLSLARAMYRDTTHTECLVVQGNCGDAALISSLALNLNMRAHALVCPLGRMPSFLPP